MVISSFWCQQLSMAVVNEEICNNLQKGHMDSTPYFHLNGVKLTQNIFVEQATSGEESIAVFTPLKRHPFKKDELPTLNFFSDVSNEEMIFLILALLFQDLRLPPSKEPKVRYCFQLDAL
jgi:hypothetical protein